MFKDLPEGQTHFENDGCGEKTHNKSHIPMTTKSEILQEFDEKFAPEKIWVVPSTDNKQTIQDLKDFLSHSIDRIAESMKIEQEEKEQLDKNDPDNYGGCYAIAGYNDATRKYRSALQERLKEVLK